MKIPRSIYRLQLNSNFTFKNAEDVIPYLYELGISDVYASPIFKTKKGSLHGYDVADPLKLNPEIGTRAEFEKLIQTCSLYGLGWIQDIVPNHMAFDSRNTLLMDLLENGPDVLPLHYFDIEWNHPYESIRGKLLAPLLGDVYSNCLEQGEIKLIYDKDGFSLYYYDHRFPLKIETYTTVLNYGLQKLHNKLGEKHAGIIKLMGVLYAIKNLPAAHEMEVRKAQVSFTKAILWELYTNDPEIKLFIDDNISEFNGVKGKPETFTLLDNLHTEQLFKLSYWKVANEELNYRRFFTVNDLISVRVEDEQVYRATHELLFEFVNQGLITGIRVDHIDGLYDPHTYLERLRQGGPELYIIVEKILGHDESLPAVWPIQGTTGYDFTNYVNQLSVELHQMKKFDRMYYFISGNKVPCELMLSEKKRLMINKYLAGDIDNLAQLIKLVSGKDRKGTDITMYGLRRALVELMTFFPVYRSYINRETFSTEDRIHLQKAITGAKRANPGLRREFDFIERFLLLRYESYASEEERRLWINVVMRFQQFTGPLMAKGFEDTLLYNYNRLISLNEVGGWPQIFGISVNTFHNFNQKRMHNWPNTINTTSTHDTKRGEDVRARINVLSEMVDEWEHLVKKWMLHNRALKTVYLEEHVPDLNDEYFLYQTLIGAYPLRESDFNSFVSRIKAYMLKANREAKVHTEWIVPDLEYENGVQQFIDKLLDKSLSYEFFDEFIPFQQKVAWYGLINSLSQCLLKMTSPGLPDFYQGTELWDLTLVDPDNRNSVDFEERRRKFHEIMKLTEESCISAIRKLFTSWEDGRIKMFLIAKTLHCRNDNQELFREGTYCPLEAEGEFRNHLVAFARIYNQKSSIIAVPRLIASIVKKGELPLGDIWKDTHFLLPAELKNQLFYNALTGEKIYLEDKVYLNELFTSFPGALIVN